MLCCAIRFNIMFVIKLFLIIFQNRKMFQIACCKGNKAPLEVTEGMLFDDYYGNRHKNIVEDMICF